MIRTWERFKCISFSSGFRFLQFIWIESNSLNLSIPICWGLRMTNISIELLSISDLSASTEFWSKSFNYYHSTLVFIFYHWKGISNENFETLQKKRAPDTNYTKRSKTIILMSQNLSCNPYRHNIVTVSNLAFTPRTKTEA